MLGFLLNLLHVPQPVFLDGTILQASPSYPTVGTHFPVSNGLKPVGSTAVWLGSDVGCAGTAAYPTILPGRRRGADRGKGIAVGGGTAARPALNPGCGRPAGSLGRSPCRSAGRYGGPLGNSAATAQWRHRSVCGARSPGDGPRAGCPLSEHQNLRRCGPRRTLGLAAARFESPGLSCPGTDRFG